MRRQAIERLLPTAYQQAAGPGSVLATLLDVMEGMHERSEEQLAGVADLFSPYRAPERLLPFLAGWVALDHIAPQPSGSAPLPIPAGRLRDLVAQGAPLARWRGTAAGLKAVVETATGVPGFTVEEPADRPFQVVLRAPPAARPQLALIRRIVEAEKPAAVVCAVVCDGDRSDSKGANK